ncbi:hypothetical protein BXY75_0004 [Ulvibacter antarcticus]|uniref:Uncharacterized protein n=2 Tax=Ulvibacter antarcticus TaxID=442714 RepID=A0A3L9Z592_9FLAO|nr:hypothetical protein BXY75_0004 [Ulvibacter antarcticus]
MGTNTGTAISILTLIGMGFGAGVYYQNLEKNVEIIEIKKNNFIELKNLVREIDNLKIENKELILKIADYEQEKSE